MCVPFRITASRGSSCGIREGHGRACRRQGLAVLGGVRTHGDSQSKASTSGALETDWETHSDPSREPVTLSWQTRELPSWRKAG